MEIIGEIPNDRGQSDRNVRNNRPPSKILVDGGDPEETQQIKQLLGFVDGQTTNPSLIANQGTMPQRIITSSRSTVSRLRRMTGWKVSGAIL